MKSKGKYLLSCVGASLISGWAGSALAQETNAPNISEKLTTGADDIIVTARKRSESVQDVPAAISAIGGLELRQRNVSDFRDLARQVPNVSYGSQVGATLIAVRGVGTQVETGVSEPSVAIYVDGVYLSRSTMASLAIKDMERVEVLRGPQGTLYGRNATGGAVNFIGASPTKDLTFGGTLRLGSYSETSGDAYVSGPLSEKVLVRISGGKEYRKGYVRNIFNGQRFAGLDRWFGRMAVQLLPSDDVTIDLNARYSDDKSLVGFAELFYPSPPGVFPIGTIEADGPFEVAAETRGSNRFRTLITGATISWEIDEKTTLKSISSYVRHRNRAFYDADETNYAFINVGTFRRPTRTLSQEFDLSGDTGKLKWLVGAFYFNENFAADLPVIFPNGLGASRPPGTRTVSRQNERTRSYALFADLTYSVTNALRIVAGGRYNYEKKKFLQTVGLQLPTGFVGTANLPNESKLERFLPKLGLQFDLSPNILSYVQYQKGLKSGGMNLSVLSGFYQPESITSYEGGLKSTLMDGRMTLNLAAFHYDYQNYQLMRFETAGNSFIQNADAKVKGIEAELAARVVPNLKLALSASYLDAKYSNFRSADPSNLAAGLQDLKGRRLNRSPETSFQGSADWLIPIQGSFLSGIRLRGDFYHSSEIFFRPFNTARDRQGAYTILNASIAIEQGPNHTLRFFATNLTDRLVKAQSLYSGGQRNFAGNYLPPQMFGTELSIRY